MQGSGGLGAWSIEISEWMLLLLALGFVVALIGIVKLVKLLWAAIGRVSEISCVGHSMRRRYAPQTEKPDA